MQDLNRCIMGDAFKVLPKLIKSGFKAQCVVTSPPYWGLRNYGVVGQLGLEKTPHKHISRLVELFSMVKEILNDDGVLWLNYGDTYAQSHGNGWLGNTGVDAASRALKPIQTLPHKNIYGLPWRLAIALQDNGWILRTDVIWAKPNPMPESVKDRPTRSHEYLFLLAKKTKYFYNSDDAKEACASTELKAFIDSKSDKQRGHSRRHAGFNGRYAAKLSTDGVPTKRNYRTVWTIAAQPLNEQHFATFPEKLVERCIRAGSREGDIILDPFMGSGTVAVVSEKWGRKWLGIELNPKYIEIQHRRLKPLRVSPSLF